MLNINEKFPIVERPIKILQFGEGNFLRCFVDWIVANMNENEKIDFSSNVVVVQPLEKGMVEGLKNQNGLYTVLLEGILNNQTIDTHKQIDCLGDFINPYTEYQKYLSYATSKDLMFIISNTTEAGIVYDESDTDFTITPRSYPGKLLSFLKCRYEVFNHDSKAGLDIIPCELIDKNGDTLKEVLVKLAKKCLYDNEFINWLINSNRFYNTLVDRIVPGYPRDKVDSLRERLGYIDNFMVKGEIFHLWVIEDHYQLSTRLPADKILNVKFVNDVTLYKERKVKILNGSHTLMVPVSYLKGHDTVIDTMNDPQMFSFIKGYIFDEVIPVIDLPHDDMVSFANLVLERFQNPYVRHELMSIALNSITKYKTRILDTVIQNLNIGCFPKNALYSFASLIYFYRGKRGNESIILNDDQVYLDFFTTLWKQYDNKEINTHDLIIKVLQLDLWNVNLWKNDKVVDFINKSLDAIIEKGIINDVFLNELHFL